MKKEIFKKISVRVILFIVLASVLSAILVYALNDRTKQIESQLAMEMEADMILPVFFDDSEWIQTAGEETTEEVTNSQTTEYTSSEVVETEGDTESEAASLESSALSETEDSATEDTSTETDEDITEDTDDSQTESTLDEPDTTEIQSSSDISSTTTAINVEKTSVAPVPSTTVEPTTVAPTTTPTTAPTTATPTTTVEPTTVAPTTAAPVIENPVPMAAAESTAFVSAEQMAVVKNRIVQRINELRASLGLGTLALNDCLNSGSILRSQELPVAWSHTRPNGERGIYILAGCGGWYREAISALQMGQPYNCAFGENLAVSYSESNYTGTEAELIAVADEMFEMWVNSESHYTNMIYPGFRYMGIGLNVNMDDVFHAFWACTLFSN